MNKIKIIALILLCLPFQIHGEYRLSLAEKVGQLLVVNFYGEEPNADAEYLINEIGVGGFIYYNWSNGLNSFEQVKNLSCGLQKLAADSPTGIPLMISVDQEGGKVTRLKNGFTPMLDNQTIASYGDLLLAKQQAIISGKELFDAGINVNFSPVVDICNNPRSYGISPEVVIDFARQSIEGFHQAGIKTTLKHYPGHGDAVEDSHYNLPIISKTLKELQNHELKPFEALANSVDVIMTGHLLMNLIDSENCATLSPVLLGILRNDIGFKGVIITDSLVMQGVLKSCVSIEEAAIRAIIAGCDMILLGGKLLNEQSATELSTRDISRIHQAIIEAVKSGRIEERQIDLSLQRILQLKSNLKI
jgi:beta-N-acetylhexosaminidase